MMFLLLSVILLATGATAQPADDASKIRIVCIGDSITKGVRPGTSADETFCARIQTMLRDKGVNAEVINAGVGSDRTDGALKRLDKDVLAHKPQFVMIMFGTNDSVYDIGKRGPRLSPKTYERNLHEIVERVRAADAVPIIMTEPLMGSAWLAPERNKVYAEKGLNYSLSIFMEVARRVAVELKTPLTDHFAEWEKASDADVKSWLIDGCHPNAKGHAIMAKTMMETLLPLVAGKNRDR